MKKILAFIFLLINSVLVLSYFSPTQANNGVLYQTYTYSISRNRLVPTQDAYIPLSLTKDVQGYTFNNPRDMSIDEEDRMYIADTLNARILRFSLKNPDEPVLVIGEGILQEPYGVHVNANKDVYVADFKTKEAYKFAYDALTDTYALQTTYKRPENSLLFRAGDVFEPTKIISDKGGNVYVLLSGNINGLAQFSDSGMFLGYFGGNRIPATLENMVRSLVFNEQQRRDWFKMIPRPIFNVGIDQKGLLLTTTNNESGYKKLNIANQILSTPPFGFNDVADIYTGPINNIFTISRSGYITEYTQDGNVLFIFGGQDTGMQKGLFKQPSSIAVDSKNNLYVLDSETQALQIFIPTDFALLVHHAIDLYQNGRYQESEGPWKEVLRQNSLFDLAYKGLGNAFFTDGQYTEAMKAYEIARDRVGYSNAFWEVRNVILLEQAQYMVIGLFLFFILYVINIKAQFMVYVFKPVKRLNTRLREYKLYRELMFGFYVIRHPFDGYYGIKRENKTSNFSATLLFGLFFMVYVLWIYNTGFLFNDRIRTEINFIEVAIQVLIPFVLWVIGNYLVCSIRDGEGKFSHVFQSSVYALFPMILALPVLTFISHYLTYNEAFVYDFFYNLVIMLTLIYVILMVKEIHNYTLKSSIVNIFISIFTALMILLVVFIVSLLLNEIATLVTDIITEVNSRG